MKTLLIVEDEKMIRQGIAVMAKRSGIEIQEILLCRNGEEALDILNSRDIDVMFTDIRMPKMNGLELVSEAGKMKKPPKIIVVSGYDDFNYAVEMMKHGVKNYLLKPVKRENIEEILLELEHELEEENEKEAAERLAFLGSWKHYLKNTSLPEKEIAILQRKFEQYIGEDSYISLVGVKCGEIEASAPDHFYFEDMGQGVWFVKEKEIDGIHQKTIFGNGVGISKRHKSFQECIYAYEEARNARIHAYVCGLPYYYASEENSYNTADKIPDEFVLRFVRCFPTEHMEKALMEYQKLFFQARHGKIAEMSMITLACRLQDELGSTYKKLFREEDRSIFDRQHPLTCENAEVYLDNFSAWIRLIRQCFDEEYDSNLNRNKIRKAVQYIEDNFKNDLNMAMVSNYVSMNYSLFSIAFKEYTGVNFVSYLKNLRIKEAKHLLETTDEKIYDIGRRSGFENEKHFLKSFKSICGISPTEYRRNVTLGE